MNYIGIFLLGILLLAILVFGKVFVVPYVKRVIAKKTQKQFLMDEQRDLIKLEKEVRFHMSWAKDRGESTEPYAEELREIKSKLQSLNTRYQEVELKPLSLTS